MAKANQFSIRGGIEAEANIEIPDEDDFLRVFAFGLRQGRELGSMLYMPEFAMDADKLNDYLGGSPTYHTDDKDRPLLSVEGNTWRFRFAPDIEEWVAILVQTQTQALEGG